MSGIKHEKQDIKLINVSRIFALFGQTLRQRDKCERMMISDPGLDRLGNLAILLRGYCLGTTGRDLANPSKPSDEPGRPRRIPMGLSTTPISVMFERFAEWMDKPEVWTNVRTFDPGLKGLGKLAGAVRDYCHRNAGFDLMPGALRDGDSSLVLSQTDR